MTERDRELLSAIETCKQYKDKLLGYLVIVLTDYNNRNLLLFWLLLVEEYKVTLIMINQEEEAFKPLS
jgi:hypothetical protein